MQTTVYLHVIFIDILYTFLYNFVKGMVQANDVARPMSRHSERTPLVLGGTQLHGEKICFWPKSKNYAGCSILLTLLP